MLRISTIDLCEQFFYQLPLASASGSGLVKEKGFSQIA
jgi:hypothetical protein